MPLLLGYPFLQEKVQTTALEQQEGAENLWRLGCRMSSLFRGHRMGSEPGERGSRNIVNLPRVEVGFLLLEGRCLFLEAVYKKLMDPTSGIMHLGELQL